MKNITTLKTAVIALLFFAVIGTIYMCEDDDLPINYDYKTENYAQSGPPCAKYSDLCTAPGTLNEITNNGDSLCYTLIDQFGNISDPICVDNGVFEFDCTMIDTCPIIAQLFEYIDSTNARIDTLTQSVYNIEVTYLNDSTFVYCGQDGVCDTLIQTPCQTFATCDTFQNVVNTLIQHIAADMDTSETNEIQCMISGLNEVAAGDFLTWIIQNPDGTNNSTTTLTFGNCLDVQAISGEGTKTGIYQLDIDFDCLQQQIVCPQRDSTYFKTDAKGLITEAIHVHYDPYTCAPVRDTVPHTNLDIGIVGGDSIVVTYPDGSTDTLAIEHPTVGFSCNPGDNVSETSDDSTNSVEQITTTTYTFGFAINGQYCAFEVVDTRSQVRDSYLEAFIENYYLEELCCPNDTSFFVQNVNGIDSVHIWRTYDCESCTAIDSPTPVPSQYTLGTQATPAGNGYFTQLTDQFGQDNGFFVTQFQPCFDVSGPSVLSPNANVQITLDIACINALISDTLYMPDGTPLLPNDTIPLQDVCCPNQDTIIHVVDAAGDTILDRHIMYSCAPECEETIYEISRKQVSAWRVGDSGTTAISDPRQDDPSGFAKRNGLTNVNNSATGLTHVSMNPNDATKPQLQVVHLGGDGDDIPAASFVGDAYFGDTPTNFDDCSRVHVEGNLRIDKSLHYEMTNSIENYAYAPFGGTSKRGVILYPNANFAVTSATDVVAFRCFLTLHAGGHSVFTMSVNFNTSSVRLLSNSSGLSIVDRIGAGVDSAGEEFLLIEFKQGYYGSIRFDLMGRYADGNSYDQMRCNNPTVVEIENIAGSFSPYDPFLISEKEYALTEFDIISYREVPTLPAIPSTSGYYEVFFNNQKYFSVNGSAWAVIR